MSYLVEAKTTIKDYRKKTLCPDCYMNLLEICVLEPPINTAHANGVCAWCGCRLGVRVYKYKGWNNDRA